MSLLARILEASPYLEVAVRRIYWSSSWLVELAQRRAAVKVRAPARAGTASWDKIEAYLRAQGVRDGSLIVVHSSGTALKSTGYSAGQLVAKLAALVGPEGTLAMPAIPRYDDEPQGIERMRADVSDLELVYDVQETPSWTGALPLKLMRHPGAIRSRHPLNSMVALGPLAQAMMEGNLSGDGALACGPQSAWKFCADRGAIVIALGVDMAHNLTMIHVAEDSHEREWPIRDWYRNRKFRVVDAGSVCKVVVRERHPRWAAHYAERTLSRDLRRTGRMAVASIDGILVQVLEAGELVRFLAAHRPSPYPYFMIPRAMYKAR